MKEKTYVRKNVPFDMNKPDEKELWEWLQTLPHGLFSEATKRFWKVRMEIEREDNRPGTVLRKEFNDKLNRIQLPWLAELDKMKESEDK